MAAGLLAMACSVATAKTRESITAAEPVLLDVPSQVGRVSKADGRINWEADTGALLLTATGLHFVDSSAGHSVSYHDINRFTESPREERRSIPEFPFSKRWRFGGGLEIETKRFDCWQRCIYLVVDPESGAAAVAIIAAQQAKLDVFGRMAEPRAFWLTHITRVGPHALTWDPEPKHLKRHNPAVITAIEQLLRADGGALARRFDTRVFEQVQAGLASQAQPSGWSARTTAGIALHRWDNPESAESHKSLRAADASVTSQVVSRNVLQFREQIGADGQVNIALRVAMSLWFHNVNPPHYPSNRIGFEHSVSHAEAAWLSQGQVLLEQALDRAADMLAGRLVDALGTRGEPLSLVYR